MTYNLRSSCKMDDKEEESTAPPWLTKVLEGLQQQQVLQLQHLQEQQRHQREETQSEFNLLRSELQEIRRLQSTATPASDAASRGATDAIPLTSTAATEVSPTLSRSSDTAPPATTAAPSRPATTYGPARPPAVTPPSKLSASISLRDFRAWRSSWNDYARLCQLAAFSREDQLAFLRSCFTEDMRATSQHAVGIMEDRNTVQSALDKIETHLRQQRNIAIDRVKFEEKQQEEDEPFDAFLVSIRELASDAELCIECRDQRLSTRIMSGFHNQEIRRKLLALRPFPSLETIIDLCRAEEAAQANDKILQDVMSRSSSVFSISRQRDQSQRNPSRDRGGSACGRCGNTSHLRGTCPAANQACFFCGTTGQFATVCRKKRSAQQQQAETDTLSRSRSRQRYRTEQVDVTPVSVSSLRRHLQAPKISVKIEGHRGAILGCTEATPNSGAEITVMSADTAHMLGMEDAALDRPPSINVTAANGPSMECISTFKAIIHLNERAVEDTVHVFKESRGLLLAWYTAKKLGILPDHYPEPAPLQLQQVDTRSAIKKHDAPPVSILKNSNVLLQPQQQQHQQQLQKLRIDLLSEFADVFTSEDNSVPLKPMTGPPMAIHITEDANPFAVRVARPVPHAWRDNVKKQLDEMVHHGIITPLGDEPSDWCHPLVLISKPNGGVRICVDLTKLNRHVKRPLHPLSTPREAVSSINVNTKIFPTLDAKSGYWQLSLQECSQHLTTFITQLGRFRFLRAPMDLVSTGDEYCQRGDLAFQGLSNVVKVVYDILVYDETLEDHAHHLRVVLTTCRQHGITINEKKFCCAQEEVSYCGFNLSSAGKQVDPGKITAITDFATPTNITELRSFMGLVQ